MNIFLYGIALSGGPGGIPRLRVRGADAGATVVIVPMRHFHRAAGSQLGVQAAAMRLSAGYQALCHYLRTPRELRHLWTERARASDGDLDLDLDLDLDDEVLKERRSPRERGRMGTSHDDDVFKISC